MGMVKRGLGVDLLEELLARHRRREHAEGPLRRGFVALGGRRRAAVRERNGVEACADVRHGDGVMGFTYPSRRPCALSTHARPSRDRARRKFAALRSD